MENLPSKNKIQFFVSLQEECALNTLNICWIVAILANMNQNFKKIPNCYSSSRWSKNQQSCATGPLMELCLPGPNNTFWKSQHNAIVQNVKETYHATVHIVLSMSTVPSYFFCHSNAPDPALFAVGDVNFALVYLCSPKWRLGNCPGPWSKKSRDTVPTRRFRQTVYSCARGQFWQFNCTSDMVIYKSTMEH